MKVVILAGGYGTRLAEETDRRPKPMVEIGGKPILLHIMERYSRAGFKDFYIAAGYKGEFIKEFFANYHYRSSDLFIDFSCDEMSRLNDRSPDWRVHCIDTGLNSMTGGRLLRLADHLSDGTFMCTYGDGLSDVDLTALLEFHRSHGKIATVTAVHPPARFGLLGMEGDLVHNFSEKPQTEHDWINGGFFVFEPGLFDYIEGDSSILERKVMERLVKDGELAAFRHPGFFQPMDTLREKQLLEEMWNSGEAPWEQS